MKTDADAGFTVQLNKVPAQREWRNSNIPIQTQLYRSVTGADGNCSQATIRVERGSQREREWEVKKGLLLFWTEKQDSVRQKYLTNLKRENKM